MHQSNRKLPVQSLFARALKLTELIRPANGCRGALSDLGDALAEHETGLLITVDETQTCDVDEIREWRIGRMVFAPTWRTLSDVDRRFLLALAHDDAESKLTDIADRLGATTSYAGVYRQRLLRAGIILPAGCGRITLAHHAARDWLREQNLQWGTMP